MTVPSNISSALTTLKAYIEDLQDPFAATQLGQTYALWEIALNGTGGGSGTIVLGTFRAIVNGTGYSINDIIILRQTPPNPAEYFNATTGLVIGTPNPADLGSVSTVSSVTANAGTNLNTSALALESGGNLANIASAVGTDGTPPPTKTVMIGGQHDTTIQSLRVDHQGRVLTSPTNQQTKADSLSVTIASDQGNLGTLANLPATLGAKTSANSLSITPASDAVFSVTQAPVTPAFLLTSTIQRAANTTAYTANDVYGASFELISSPAPASGQWILITDIEIIFNIAALPSGMAGFQLYTYGVTPPSAVADNGAFSLPTGDRSAIIFPNGISLGSATLARGGGSVVAQANNINVACKLTGTSLFAYLVTLAAFTPAAVSETATIRMRALAL